MEKVKCWSCGGIYEHKGANPNPENPAWSRCPQCQAMVSLKAGRIRLESTEGGGVDGEKTDGGPNNLD